MWPEDVKCPIVVGLAGLDRIVPTRPLRRYLLSHGDFTAPPASEPKSVDGLTNGVSKSCSSVGRGIAGGARNGLFRPGGGFALMSGNTRCKVHTCNVKGKCTGHGGGGQVSAPYHSSSGGLSSAASNGNGTSVRVGGQGGVHRPTAKGGGSGSGSEKSGGGAATRVELVYWSDAGHGNVLGDPWALDEFVRVATRQERAFPVS